MRGRIILCVVALIPRACALLAGNLNYFWAFAGSLNVLLYYNFAVIVYGLIMRFK